MKTNLPQIFLRFSLVLTLAVSLSAIGASQDKEAAKKASAEKKDSDKETKDEKSDPVMAIVGGDIHTVTGSFIRQGTILVKGGKILEVGQSVAVPEGAEVIDATGKTITPGFVAVDMRGVGIRTAPSGNEKLADALDPFDRNIKYSLGVGITTGCIELSSGGTRGRRRRSGEPEERFPGLEAPVEEFLTDAMLDYGDENTSLCPCCGLPVLPTEPITPAAPTQAQPRKMSVLKMSYGNLDAMLVKENVFYSPAPGALNGALERHNWRLEIKKARESIAAAEKAEKEKAKTATATAKSSTAPKPPGSSTGRSSSASGSKVKPEVLSLVKGETAMRIRANTVDEIRDMVALADELQYEIVIEGGIEAWVLAQELGAGEASVIYTPRSRREPQPGRETSSGSFVESPRLFEEKGVPFAVSALSNSISMGGLAGRDLTSLPLEAAFAVRGGASEKSALEALTITPAKMMGLEDRIGSIEKGKDADILILNGSPLDYRTYVEQAIVAGKVAYDREEDSVYPVYEREN